MKEKDLWQIKEQLYHLYTILRDLEHLTGNALTIVETIRDLVVGNEKKE